MKQYAKRRVTVKELEDLASDIGCLASGDDFIKENLRYEHRVSLYYALLTARTILETAGMGKP